MDHIQIGLPELPEAGNDLHFRVLRAWLDDCDDQHFKPTCRPTRSSSMTGDLSWKMPTRLIDVGHVGDNTVRLRATQPEDTGNWVALSYRWGPEPPNGYFSTTRENLEENMNGLEFAKLPLTFQDAIRVTRALGQRFLWIDSMCIVQGSNGDFQQEFKRMEHVYSGAYCVLAASCATDQGSGFLSPRLPRRCVSLMSADGVGDSIYVCELTEDFRGHVLLGDLNRRGWVLQEHALARRTLFFTNHQTYWECGHGVRCETMIRMTK